MKFCTGVGGFSFLISSLAGVQLLETEVAFVTELICGGQNTKAIYACLIPQTGLGRIHGQL